MTRAEHVEALVRWRSDPVACVVALFSVVFDRWQEIAFRALTTDRRIIMLACKGPGKSFLLALAIWWFLLCHPDAQVIAVSITSDNLRDNLWKELGVWYSRSPILQATFKFGAERIVSRERPQTWWCSARSFAADADTTQQANTLAGFHGKDVMVVLDELGDYPDGVAAAAEGIFANNDDGGRKLLLAAGNATRNSGPLYRYATIDSDLCKLVRITGDPDGPNRSPRIDLEWAREQIRKHGRDSNWVKTNILAEFPSAANAQLIGVDAVLAAMARRESERAYRGEARVWGLDPARYGDDEAVLFKRQGCMVFQPLTWRGLDGNELGDRIARELHKAERDGEPCDALFVDVGGIGASVYDRLNALGVSSVIGVDFASRSTTEGYGNRRSEMWHAMASWLTRSTSCLPEDPALRAELTAPEFVYKSGGGKRTLLYLESKEDIRRRLGGSSPDRADALALTFAATVEPRSHASAFHQTMRVETEYDPFNERVA